MQVSLIEIGGDHLDRMIANTADASPLDKSMSAIIARSAQLVRSGMATPIGSLADEPLYSPFSDRTPRAALQVCSSLKSIYFVNLLSMLDSISISPPHQISGVARPRLVLLPDAVERYATERALSTLPARALSHSRSQAVDTAPLPSLTVWRRTPSRVSYEQNPAF